MVGWLLVTGRPVSGAHQRSLLGGGRRGGLRGGSEGGVGRAL